MVTTALPQIPRDLHSTVNDLQWVVDAYALTLAALLLTGGRWPIASAGGRCSPSA